MNQLPATRREMLPGTFFFSRSPDVAQKSSLSHFLFTAPPGVTTLPIWIFQNLFRPNQGPVVNVVAAILVVASIIPIYLSQRLAGDTGHGGGRL